MMDMRSQQQSQDVHGSGRQRWRRVVTLIGALLLTCLLRPAPEVAAAAPQDDSKPRIGGTYRRPLRDNPATLDPARPADMYAYPVFQQLFDGLVPFDSQ